MAQLSKPTITVAAVGQFSVVLSGLSDDDASGWKYKIGSEGTATSVTPDDDGKVWIQGLSPETTSAFYAQAVGDGTEFTDSEWSDAVSGTTCAAGQFYEWTTDAIYSHDGLTKQNACFKARIAALDATVLPVAKVSSCSFSAYKIVNLNGSESETVITGFDGVTVPTSCFKSSFDTGGFNFEFIPDQTTYTLMSDTAKYRFVFTVKLTTGNSIRFLVETFLG